MTSIAITGANGFIGKNLCKYFNENGYKVYALQRNIKDIHTKGIEYISYDLTHKELEDLPKTDYVIHAAYLSHRQGNNSFEINKIGTQKLLNHCRQNDTQFIFISSLSSQENALSEYGKTKFAIEKFLDLEKDLLLVPGLVIGDGGLYAEVSSFIKKIPIVPSFGNGKQVTYSISINDFCESVAYLIKNKIKGKKYLLNNQSFTLNRLYKTIAQHLNKRIVCINIPYFIADKIFTILEIIPAFNKIGKESYLGIKQGVKLENKDGFYLNDFNFSNLQKSIEVLHK